MNAKNVKFKLDSKILISTIWVFVLINMIYADIIGMLKPGYVENLTKISRELSPETVLMFSIFMEVPIIMILLSRVLDYQTNRIANLIAVPISILWVVVPALMPSLGTTPLSYVFFATIEVISMSLIFWIAWKWPKPDAI